MKKVKVIRQIALFFMGLWCGISTVGVIKEPSLNNIILMIIACFNLGIYFFLEWKDYTRKRDWYLKYVATFYLLNAAKTERYRKQLSGDLEEVENLTIYCIIISDILLSLENDIESYSILEDTKFYDLFKEMQEEHMEIRRSMI